MGKRNEATKHRFELKRRSRDPSYKRIFGNYPAKKFKKGTPTVTRLSFEMAGNDTMFIDIAQALSAVNRRAYRQGLYYYVNSVELYDQQSNTYDIHVLPDTWITRAAHRRAKGVFDAMNEKALHASGTITPKYHDFKVYLDNLHRTTGTTVPSLYHDNAAHTPMASDDWAYSRMVSADDDGDGSQNADEFYLHMIGAHSGSSDNWNSIGVIKSYGDSRAQPQTSNPVVPTELLADPLVNMFDGSEEQTNEILENLGDDNDAVPYDANVYVGENTNSLTQVARLSTHEGGGGRVSIGAGFCAPCGLIMVDPENGAGNTGGNDGNQYRIVLNLAVGTYNGVYAERM